ncbi:MAG: hypothetical protein AAGA58_05540 [Verrucomicrobiota bacterium]
MIEETQGESLLPIHRYGDPLRILLSQPSITASELRHIVASRGIAVSRSSKEEIIPILTGGLLTSREISALQQIAEEREQSPKLRTRVLTPAEHVSLPPILTSKFDPQLFEPSGFLNYHLEDIKPFRSSPGGEWEMTYTIERQDLSKDWVHANRSFEGSITVTKRGDDFVLSCFHSSPETEKINSRIFGEVRNRFKEKSDKTEEKSFLFGNFTDEQRISLFLAFTGLTETQATFERLEALEIAPANVTDPLPPQLEWLSDGVSEARLAGDDLSDFSFLTDSNLAPFVSPFASDSEFTAKGFSNSRYCARIEFSGYPAAGITSELQISIRRLTTKGGTEARLRRSFLKVLENKKIEIVKSLQKMQNQ